MARNRAAHLVAHLLQPDFPGACGAGRKISHHQDSTGIRSIHHLPLNALECTKLQTHKCTLKTFVTWAKESVLVAACTQGEVVLATAN